jgi:pSer/pThr/pTyr-binding forkhead associated (FHA) protein
MAVLIGMSGEVKGQSFEIEEGELTIGRSEDCTITLNNPTVSGHHCSLIRENDRYTLKDNGSTNGTRVNSKDITESVLSPKDLVQVGSVEFMFDAEHVEAVETNAYAETQVEVAPGPAAAPESFANISPFGTRRKESKGIWFVLITIVGILALVVVALFFFKLATTG